MKTITTSKDFWRLWLDAHKDQLGPGPTGVSFHTNGFKNDILIFYFHQNPHNE